MAKQTKQERIQELREMRDADRQHLATDQHAGTHQRQGWRNSVIHLSREIKDLESGN